MPSKKHAFPAFLTKAAERLKSRGLDTVLPPKGLVESTVKACEQEIKNLSAKGEE